MRRGQATIAIALACVGLSGTAQASQSLKLSVGLTPEHLGQGTTVGFDFDIASTTGLVPPPLTEVDLRYPGDLGVTLSGLGLATCSAGTLEVLGPEGCPAEARMGYGSVLAEIAIGGEVIVERATLAVLRAPTRDGHISLLFYAAGEAPVYAQIVFTGALLAAAPPFGGLLHIDVPLVPSVPGAPDVAVAQIHGTLGPQHLTYYRHVGGGSVPYNPQGILLPNHCPRGGFPFAAELGFLDGSRTNARAVVSCPLVRRRRR
ncbi:MAG TPA: hypothetical protein VK707_09230 [Solirubrobacteraceae bacterium]|nr:hypothetical protein [Solirubrobacteraceae bacterium]